MTEPAALRPLTEVMDQIRRLDDYASEEELAAAVRAVADAVERSLRARLRADPTAPDDHRLGALAADALSLDEVVQSLRARDLIALETAGTVHELVAAADRAERGAARPADADLARTAVDRLRTEFGQGPAPGEPVPVEETPPGPPSVVERGGRWMRWVAALFAAFAVVAAAWVLTRGGAQEYDAALVAFRAGRLDSAAAGFERVLEDRPGHVTSMLYLARSYRRLDRPGEAAGVLREAVERAPDDPGVRRELGHLFMDLGRPITAIAQYERALEHEPEEPLNWAALIRAFRATGDPRAEQLLRDAPAEVQATLSGS
jgi:tetratricopeptide (TPR) repeat protein